MFPGVVQPEGTLARPALALPPSGFHPAENVLWAEPASDPHRNSPSRHPSGAQLAGLRYEKKAKAFLSRELGPALSLGPWWRYRCDEDRERWCQPDAVLEGALPGGHVRRSLTIFEIKLRWSDLAFWQLVHLYRPVARRLYPESTLSLVAVVRSFDPAVVVPRAPRLVGTASEGCSGIGADSEVSVLVWRP